MYIQVNQRVGIIATSGSGKSTTAYTMLEELRNGNYPLCILDVKNEYGGLPKTHVIYASQTKASRLASELKKTNASCVVFMKDLTLKQKGKWINKFLLECQRVSRDIPIMIVIEELRLFAPQDKGLPCKEAISDLAQGGRSQGYGCLLISQRCAKVDKNVLGSLTDLFIMKHYLDQDLKYLLGYLGKENINKLPQFQKGQAFHLNFQKGTISEIQFSNNPRKKKGGTPQPTPVTPKIMGSKKDKDKREKPKGWGIVAIIIIGLIIVITIGGIILWFILKKEEEEEE